MYFILHIIAYNWCKKNLALYRTINKLFLQAWKLNIPPQKIFFFKAKIFEIDCLFFLYIVLKQLSFTSLVVHVQKSVLELPEESLWHVCSYICLYLFLNVFSILLFPMWNKQTKPTKTTLRKCIIFISLFICSYPNCLSAIVYGGITSFTRGMTQYMQPSYARWGKLVKNTQKSSLKKGEVKIKLQEFIFAAT